MSWADKSTVLEPWFLEVEMELRAIRDTIPPGPLTIQQLETIRNKLENFMTHIAADSTLSDNLVDAAKEDQATPNANGRKSGFLYEINVLKRVYDFMGKLSWAIRDLIEAKRKGQKPDEAWDSLRALPNTFGSRKLQHDITLLDKASALSKDLDFFYNRIKQLLELIVHEIMEIAKLILARTGFK